VQDWTWRKAEAEGTWHEDVDCCSARREEIRIN
jgi:hypothetical protein